MIRFIKADAKRAFQTLGFWGGMLGAVLMGVAAAYTYIQQILEGRAYGTYEEITRYAIHSNLFLMVLPIVCTLPFAANFNEEYQSRFLLFSVSRCGKIKFLLSKICITALSGGLLAGVSVLLFLTGNFIFFYQTPDVVQNSLLSGIIEMRKEIAVCFLGGCVWAMAGGFASAVAKNSYLGYAFPFLLYYILSAFQERYYKGYTFLNPREWMAPVKIQQGTAVGISLFVLAVLSVGYCAIMERRIRDV